MLILVRPNILKRWQKAKTLGIFAGLHVVFRKQFTAMDLTLILVLIVVLGFAAVIVLLVKRDRGRLETEQRLTQFAETAEHLRSNQAELSAGLQQSQTNVNERLEALSKRLGDGLTQQTEKTGGALKELHERLVVIDTAQKKITDLSEKVVGLQDILSNKQARGAFGEIQLNDLVRGVLPPSAFEFQVTLSNGKRADCLLKLPNPPGPIAIDSKFPLESYSALHDAKTEIEITAAERAFSNDIKKHIKDIAEKYILPGETSDSALMFLPSEAVYAELQANFQDLVQESFLRKVFIVSPTTLWATLNTIRAVLKDVRMREQADVIQSEVVKMLRDVERLDDRVAKLQSHMGQADDDLRKIRISTDKVTKRGERITEIEIGEGGSADELETAPAQPRLEDNN